MILLRQLLKSKNGTEHYLGILALSETKTRIRADLKTAMHTTV